MLPKIHKEFLTKCGEDGNTVDLPYIIYGYMRWTGAKVSEGVRLSVMGFIVDEICEECKGKWISREMRLGLEKVHD